VGSLRVSLTLLLPSFFSLPLGAHLNLEDGKSCTTFDEALAKDAEIIIGTTVRVLVQPNKRKAGTWTYMGFDEIPQPAATEQKEELPWQ
jgi:hypothetical protein